MTNNDQWNDYSGQLTAPRRVNRKERRGFSITALVLGIVAESGSWIPILNNVTIVAGIVAVPFAVIALFGTHHVMAAIGLFLAILGVAVGIGLQVHWGHQLDNLSRNLNPASTSSTSAPAAPAAANPTATVTLTAHGRAGDTVTYSTDAADSPDGTKVTLDRTGAWTYTYTVPTGEGPHFAMVEVTSNAQGDAVLHDTMSCSIAQNGASRDQQTNALMVLCSSGTLGE